MGQKTSRMQTANAEGSLSNPLSYAQYKYPKWLSEPDTVKVRLPQGDQYVCELMSDASNAETYLK